jgi:hypothetical protein
MPMRENVCKELRQPYSTEELDVPHVSRVASRLGVAVPGSSALGREIRDDLDPEVFGIGWWADLVPLPARILISDYVAVAVSTIEANLVQAALHRLDLLDAWNDEARPFRESLLQRGEIPIPPAMSLSMTCRLSCQICTWPGSFGPSPVRLTAWPLPSQ